MSISNLFEFMQVTGATTVSVSKDNSAIIIVSDSDALTPEEFTSALRYGEAVPSAEAGMLLPMAQAIARTYGWELTSSSA
jgi:hypothetical protein